MAITSTHMATIEDDALHKPGPDAKPLWNESYWFTFVDPKANIAFAARFGMLPMKGYGNFYLLLSSPGELLYSHIDQRAKLPEQGAPLSMCGYTIEVEKPLEHFHLTYANEGVTVDLTWESNIPTLMWPHRPGTVDEVAHHIEHSGRAKGTITHGGTTYEIDCFAHRDHSFGDERNWNSFEEWEYLSGEIDEKFWFNAVRIRLTGMPAPAFIGCLWDGEEGMWCLRGEMNVTTAEAGTRATGVDLKMTDEKGREHHITGETAYASGNVWFGPTCLREGYAKWTYGDRVGYGVHEHGYTERLD